MILVQDPCIKPPRIDVSIPDAESAAVGSQCSARRRVLLHRGAGVVELFGLTQCTALSVSRLSYLPVSRPVVELGQGVCKFRRRELGTWRIERLVGPRR